MNEATRRQQDAAHPDRSTWLAANAGSGKTRVLTDRVARLLFEGVLPQNILCLTYTKAAASEMQNRLFARLGKWAMLDDETLRHSLRELGLSLVLNPNDLAQARTLFARAIETPGGLKIQTIHAFCAALLNAQPMGFYSPHTLVGDARRHGVAVLTPDINKSAAGASLEWVDGPPDDPAFRQGSGVHHTQWGVGGPAVRLGLGSVRHVGEELAEKLDEGRPWHSIEDVKRRTGCSIEVLEALATAGCSATAGRRYGRRVRRPRHPMLACLASSPAPMPRSCRA